MLKLLIFNEQMRLKESSHSLDLLMKLPSNSKAASCPDGNPWEQLAIHSLGGGTCKVGSDSGAAHGVSAPYLRFMRR